MRAGRACRDPAWRVAQRAAFGPAPPAARRLIRQRQRIHGLEELDRQLLGPLKAREARLRVDPTGRDPSAAPRDAGRALERALARRGEDFGQAARRRRERGLSVGLPGKVLPFRPRHEDVELEAERARELEAEIDVMEQALAAVDATPAASELTGRAVPDAEEQAAEDGGPAEGGGALDRARMGAWLRWRGAEARMRQAFAALEAAAARAGAARCGLRAGDGRMRGGGGDPATTGRADHVTREQYRATGRRAS